MRLTPVEIRHQPLRRGWRGYDRDDVDTLLKHAAASFEEVWRQRDELGARVAELEAELGSYRDSERLLGESLVTVQRFADELRTEAKKEAAKLIRKAQADQEQKMAAAERELEDVRAEIERLRSLERDLRAKLRALLQDGLGLIEDGDVGKEAPPSAALAKIRGPKPKPARADDRKG